MRTMTKRKFKTEFANAVKLFILLVLLFWSCTWNSDPNLDFSQPKPSKIETSKVHKATTSSKSDVSVWNQHSDLIETFTKVRYSSKKTSKTVSTTRGILPPFNEWKQMERMKYAEKLSSKDATVNHHKKTTQRKLNYASVKCGAKILASNPEARQRIAILNEKPDEYMLNPCRVKMWFIIELCDTVEVTQVELANYELYSSSPREFSVFWSEVYPTPIWHLLGTFEARDQRTMQTFHLNSKNFGKFIRVVIYSHHGKEHYCLLSVIRVLGYSMVEKFEDIDETENSNSLSDLDNQSGAQFDKNLTLEKEKNSRETIEKEQFARFDRFSEQTCSSYLRHCPKEHGENSIKLCSNKLKCRFLKNVLQKYLKNCDKFSLPIDNKMEVISPNTRKVETHDENINLTNTIFPLNVKIKYEKAKKSTGSTFDDILKDYKFVNTVSVNLNSSISVGDNTSEANINTVKFDRNLKGIEYISDIEGFNKQEKNARVQEAHTNNNYDEKCACEKGKIVENVSRKNKDLTTIKEYEDDLLILETDVDSAGLIQKESVLLKLTTRIKASEIELDLINKYLQQLSQSYRQHMDDMQVMFNHTVRAIDAATKKADLIDEKQQESIDTLQKKISSLSRKVDYLMNGQRDLLKRVFEMHAFFLILEIIIISTIFTIFMNIFHQKNILMKQQFLNKKEMRVV